MLAVEWDETVKVPFVEVVSTVATQNRFVKLKRGPAKPLSTSEHSLYTASTRLIPTDGIVKATADKIVGKASDDLKKARRIYGWVVANTFRDPKTRGCGLGNIKFVLETGDLSGKYADINTLYVGLARAVGLPARDLYGIRVVPSKFGYHSLGANSQDVTKAQHCRAAVYLSDIGWVPVDPADVRMHRRPMRERAHVAWQNPQAHIELAHGRWEIARNNPVSARDRTDLDIGYNKIERAALPCPPRVRPGILGMNGTNANGEIAE